MDAMTAQEARMVANEMKESNKQLVDQFAKLSSEKSKELAIKLLMEAGICTKNGNLRRPYKTAKKSV
jgi:hypothetical protein